MDNDHAHGCHEYMFVDGCIDELVNQCDDDHNAFSEAEHTSLVARVSVKTYTDPVLYVYKGLFF